VFDHSSVRNVVHVILRDPNLIEAADAGLPAATPTATSAGRRGAALPVAGSWSAKTWTADTRAVYSQ
jgi:hypothetical protein